MAWIIGGWWTKGSTVISTSAMEQIEIPLFQRTLPAILPNDQVRFYKGNTIARVMNYLHQHGYAQWTSYQPNSRFWPFQWIEGGWLVALSVIHGRQLRPRAGVPSRPGPALPAFNLPLFRMPARCRRPPRRQGRAQGPGPGGRR
jgi:hypothetical protein